VTLFGRGLRLDLNVLGEVDDEGEVGERSLVDAANAVVNEETKL